MHGTYRQTDGRTDTQSHRHTAAAAAQLGDIRRHVVIHASFTAARAINIAYIPTARSVAAR